MYRRVLEKPFLDAQSFCREFEDKLAHFSKSVLRAQGGGDTCTSKTLCGNCVVFVYRILLSFEESRGQTGGMIEMEMEMGVQICDAIYDDM